MSTAEAALDGPAPKRGKRKLLLVLVPVLLLGGGAGAWFSGLLPRLLGHGGEHAAEAAAEHGAAGEKTEKKVAEAAPTFLDLPDIVANLNAGRRTAFIKLKAKFELSKPEDVAPCRLPCRASSTCSSPTCARCARRSCTAPPAPIACGRS